MPPRTIELDPAAPFLDDHRPNGRPLLGTVACLELLAEAAEVGSKISSRSIEAVTVLSPLIFASDTPRMVRIVSQATDYALESGTDRHLTCRFPGESPGARPTRLPAFPGPQAVGAQEIYRLFFHGPAFQVVEAAEWRDGALLTRLQAPLPPWHRDGRATLTAPRLLELALQSAGLLALAERLSMEIPCTIARIDRYLPTGESAPPALFALAERGAEGIDIDVLDHDGLVHLRVTGYRTAPLPFPIARDRMETLHRALRSGH